MTKDIHVNLNKKNFFHVYLSTSQPQYQVTYGPALVPGPGIGVPCFSGLATAFIARVSSCIHVSSTGVITKCCSARN